MAEEMDKDPDSHLRGLSISKRRILQLSAMGALGGVGITSALSPDGENGDIFGGTMALDQAYIVAEGERTWYQGPDSAKSNISGQAGDRYSSTDFNVEYYWDGGWKLLNAGSENQRIAVFSDNVDLVSIDDLTPFHVSDTPPANPNEKDLWIDTS